ncbi:MAG: 50S ribosomal protein L5 [Candidatus Dadabacteria bacterium]|nr:MAG: 50S ribosomal protein L5 [Candidatus Dadabacteria bacterium]
MIPESRLYRRYREEIVPKLQQELGYRSIMQVPKLQKVVLNSGVGEAISNSKALESVQYAMAQIAGQKPVVTRARKSVASFKVRQGMPIGVKVTLRGMKMYHFLDKLVSIALPRSRDFRGLSPKSFDGHGNYTLGVKEQTIFPEVDVDKIDKIRGLDITVTTTAEKDDEAKRLLEELGFPFRE